MKNLLLLFFTFISSYAFSQGPYLSIVPISHNRVFNFPIIHAEDSLTAFKINTHLQLAELDLLKGKERGHIFEQVMIDDGRIYGGKKGIAYYTLQNTSRNLSIRFRQSSCGMTCTYWQEYYNFNPQNGDRYFLQDFFSPSQFQVFKKQLTKNRKQQAISQIDPSDTYLLNDLLLSIEEDLLKNFYFSNDSIYVDGEHLLSKNAKFLGLDLITAIAISDIQLLLNDFGKSALITGEDLAQFSAQQEPQLYMGKISGKYDIVLLFRHYDDSRYVGTYAYLRYGLGINLDGKLTEDRYWLSELNEDFEVISQLVFTKKNGELFGMWANKDCTKKLLLKAKKK